MTLRGYLPLLKFDWEIHCPLRVRIFRCRSSSYDFPYDEAVIVFLSYCMGYHDLLTLLYLIIP